MVLWYDTFILLHQFYVACKHWPITLLFACINCHYNGITTRCSQTLGVSIVFARVLFAHYEMQAYYLFVEVFAVIQVRIVRMCGVVSVEIST